VIIDRFQDENGKHTFLSNFYPSPIQVTLSADETLVYPTVEHYFQACKNPDLDYQREVAAASTPGKAKRLGRKVQLMPGWDSVKLDIMRLAIEAKFWPGSQLTVELLCTEDAYLVEGNTWGDTFWGKVDGRGSNWLGIILMARRTELLHNITGKLLQKG